MVAKWRKEMIERNLRETEEILQRLNGFVPIALQQAQALLASEDFDQPTPMDELERELDGAVNDAEPQFIFNVGWYMGEEWIEATGKATCVVDALGELAGAVEQETKKEQARLAKVAAREAVTV